MNECPKCKSQGVVAGRLSVAGRSTRLAVAFVPGKLKWYQFSLEGGAALSPEAFVCPACNLVWASVAYPENLRKILSRVGDSQ